MRDEALDVLPTLRSGYYKEMFDKAKIAWYDYHNGYWHTAKITLIQAMNDLAIELKKLGESEEFDNPAFLNVYRNGFSVCLKSFNRTGELFLDEFRTVFEEYELIIIDVIAICSAVVLSGTIVFILIILILFERQRRGIWKIITTLPLSTILEFGAKSQERIIEFHNTDIIRSDKSKKNKNEHKPRYVMLIQNYLLFAIVFVGIGLFGTMYGITYKVAYADQKHTFEIAPHTINAGGDRVAEVHLVQFWTQEKKEKQIYDLIKSYTPYTTVD